MLPVRSKCGELSQLLCFHPEEDRSRNICVCKLVVNLIKCHDCRVQMQEKNRNLDPDADAEQGRISFSNLLMKNTKFTNLRGLQSKSKMSKKQSQTKVKESNKQQAKNSVVHRQKKSNHPGRTGRWETKSTDTNIQVRMTNTRLVRQWSHKNKKETQTICILTHTQAGWAETQVIINREDTDRK